MLYMLVGMTMAQRAILRERQFQRAHPTPPPPPPRGPRGARRVRARGGVAQRGSTQRGAAHRGAPQWLPAES
jgi:hypothetical protein